MIKIEATPGLSGVRSWKKSSETVYFENKVIENRSKKFRTVFLVPNINIYYRLASANGTKSNINQIGSVNNLFG